MSPEDAARWVAQRWGVAHDDVTIELLDGGLVNDVFRASTGHASFIVKHAPPHVATAPDIALSPHRLEIEERCLRELGFDGALAAVSTERVRAPHWLAFDGVGSVLVMEDLGALRDLGVHLTCADHVDPALGANLGTFIARLHAISSRMPALLGELHNRDVQETRARNQYAQIGAWLATIGHADHVSIGARARGLGQRFLEPGRCVVMGDLWARSVLLDGAQQYLIDWEFAHAGNPAQDIGHLAAHLWMHARRAANAERASQIDLVRGGFVAAYHATLADHLASALVTPETVREAEIHAGCEVLARVLGPFRVGFLYGALAADDPITRHAVDTACDAIRGTASLVFP